MSVATDNAVPAPAVAAPGCAEALVFHLLAAPSHELKPGVTQQALNDAAASGGGLSSVLASAMPWRAVPYYNSV